jgi:PAS domain S-box-containing protein
MQNKNDKAKIKAEQEKELPFWMKRYANANFITEQRVRFAFYLSITLIIVMIALIIFTIYNQIKNPIYESIHYPTIAPLLSVLIVFIISTFFLINGHYTVASNVILISALAAVWFVMWVDENVGLPRLNTITYIVAALSMAPLLIGKKNYLILVYTGVNLLLLFFFLHITRSELGISDADLRDYILDSTIPMLFVGLVGFSVFTINRNAHNLAEEEIKERKEAELALSQSERKFRDMTELLPQTVFESDLEGNLKYVNKLGLNLFGFTEDEIFKGINFIAYILEKDEIKKNIQTLLKENISKGNIYTALNKDGKQIPIQIYSSLIKEGQKPVGIRGIAVDITESIEAEKVIRQSQELFQSLLESIPNPVFLSDMDGRYLLVNKAFSKEIGLPPEMIVGNTSYDIGFSIDEKSQEFIISELAKKGFVENYESIVIDKNGNKIDTLYFSRTIDLNNEKGILSSLINITEKKNVERELEKYRNHLEILVKERTDELQVTNEELSATNEELSATNEELYHQREELGTTLDNLKKTQKQLIQSEKMASLGILSAGVAHEINNPLNFISGGISGIEKYIKENLREHEEHLSSLFNAIDEGVNRVSMIVNSLNRFSRQTDATNEHCKIHSVIDDCLVILYNQIKNRVQVVKNYTDQPFWLYCNTGKLNQAVLNILTNAAQAIEGNGMITISTKLNDEYLELTITDTGKGISNDALNKIFDPFFTTKDPGKGTGLGLSITYEIIKDMNGTIDYHSEEGLGTTVKVLLPVKINISE